MLDGGFDEVSVTGAQALDAPLDVVGGQSAAHAVRCAVKQRDIAGKLGPAVPRMEALDHSARALPLLAFEVEITLGHDQERRVAVVVGEPRCAAAGDEGKREQD